jgi:hypothetical protein
MGFDPQNPSLGYKLDELKAGEKDSHHHILDFVQLVVLLFHLYRAEQEPELKACHALKTFQEQVAPWKGRTFRLTSRDLEDALWACQMLSEKGEFWHPEGKTVKEYAQECIGKKFGTWDEFYCWIREN